MGSSQLQHISGSISSEGDRAAQAAVQ
eukprot:SAG11_NODE_19809_length_458_cov_1.534819_2_plen_26_part_01